VAQGRCRVARVSYGSTARIPIGTPGRLAGDLTLLVTLEDLGFCRKGEGGPFVADGRLATPETATPRVTPVE